MTPLTEARLASPLVSILIPAYNAERWIRQAVESALAQTYPFKEVIVVDDGSTDGTADALRSFGKKIRFIHSTHFGGNAARNLLLEMSNGEWLQYLDADDYLLPDKIASQIEVLEANGNTFDIICSPYILRDEADGQEIPISLSRPLDVPSEFISWGRFWTGAFLMRRSAVVQVGRWKEDQVACQEHELLLRFIRAEKRFGLCDHAAAVYRNHGSATVSKRDPLRTIRLRMELTDEFERFLRHNQGLSPVHRKLLYTARMESARSAWPYDQAYASELRRQASAEGRQWISGCPALPWGFQIADFLLGFRRAQQIAAVRQGRTVEMPGSLESGRFPTGPAHVLLVNQFFWPDGAPTGLLLEDVARKLVDDGCRITVICSHGSYHESRHDEAPPVRILKLPGLPYSRTKVGRLLSWLTFLIWASVRSLFIGPVDVVVTMTSPPGLSFVGAMLKRLRASRFWIWEMDIYPDVATALGAIKSNSRLAVLIARIMHSLRKQADGIIAIGPCMRDRLLDHGLDANKVAVAENWSDSQVIQSFDLPAGNMLRILYSGNLGLAHETDTISKVILHFRDANNVQFVFAGGGSRRREIQNLCDLHKIRNVSFEPYVDRQKLAERLARCHVGLVTLRSGCEGTLVPSKAYSFLAAGRPILYIGPGESTLARIAGEGCGWQYEPGDVEGVISLIEQLRSDRDLLEAVSVQALRIFHRKYDKPLGVRRVADMLLSDLVESQTALIPGVEAEISETSLLQDSAPQ
jgi:colanic acid biosynthesis glycosyl transferase WcaI